MLAKLSRLLRRIGGRETPEQSFDRKERDRLTAEYTGSFAKDPGQHLGITPPKS
jgi:hypothetical protein